MTKSTGYRVQGTGREHSIQLHEEPSTSHLEMSSPGVLTSLVPTLVASQYVHLWLEDFAFFQLLH